MLKMLPSLYTLTTHVHASILLKMPYFRSVLQVIIILSKLPQTKLDYKMNIIAIDRHPLR